MSAPYYAAHADGPVPQTGWAITEDGKRIRCALWQGGTRGTIILLNGRAEYIEKYAPIARNLMAAGFSAVSLDWRGQALSTRDSKSSGDVAAFTDFQRDLAALLTHPLAAATQGPRIVLAHSMGGAIALRALLEGLDVRAAIFSAPMWGVHLSGLLASIASPVSGAVTALGLGPLRVPGSGTQPYTMTHPASGNCLTTDHATYLGHRAQLTACAGLRVGGPSFRWLNLALKECADLAPRPNPDLPIMALLGTDEGVVDPAAIRTRMARPGDVRLVELPKGRHEVLFETQALRDQAWQEIHNFLDRTCPAGI